LRKVDVKQNGIVNSKTNKNTSQVVTFVIPKARAIKQCNVFIPDTMGPHASVNIEEFKAKKLEKFPCNTSR
jgi:hypothetical protein